MKYTRSPVFNLFHFRFKPIWLLFLLLIPLPIRARADEARLILPGLDPLLRTTTRERLLGPQRLYLRQKLLAAGIDPVRDAGMPTPYTRMRQLMRDRVNVDLRREMVLIETSTITGLETIFRYPKFLFLFPSPYELPGGMIYYPPRRIDAPEVRIVIDDARLARTRRIDLNNRLNRDNMLDIVSGGGRAGKTDHINLTIPIKLPRTLERIIGRGEKTNIRISGRDHISVEGKSSVTNNFTPTERRQSQSLFPSMDMEQQMQINLVGQIGEKINLEVDHNSQAIGPDATKIRLTYQGSEDEIIQTIESGDVGLTLPGSNLLGYSSNKSGLFGLKVTGQMGRMDFTVVTSKQKAESASKAFNSKGGEVSDHIIDANGYLNNRFFRLDLPPDDYVDHRSPDSPGRYRSQLIIDQNTVHVFKFLGDGTLQEGEVRNIVAIPDTTGLWSAAHIDVMTQASNVDNLKRGARWREVDMDFLLDVNGDLVAIDLGREYNYSDVLAVIYETRRLDGSPGFRVGDFPFAIEGRAADKPVELAGLPGSEQYYRMKLLKPDIPEPYTWQYVLRNIYPLGGSNIDPETFDLRIEINSPYSQPQLDLDDTGKGSGLDWFRVFGLDREDQQSQPGADGIVDKHNTNIFDLSNGLLRFPIDFDQPFNSSPEIYEFLAGTGYDFDNSLLKGQLIPQIYDPATSQNDFRRPTPFRLISSHAAAASSFNLGVSNIEEGSESVSLDGSKLTRDVDYTIDYTFGQITLKGDVAANMKADSQISVTYQYAPFMGGGNSSLLGFNVGLDLGKDNKLTSTWLYESNQVVGHKAKLGEEPSRNLVGTVNGQFLFKPYFLTHIANFISRVETDRQSTVNVAGEMAMSFPNPNTFNQAYAEDFEGIDSSDMMPISRLSWSAASVPAQTSPVAPAYAPESRLITRWYLPRTNTLRKYLNPELEKQEAQEVQQVLELYMKAEDKSWDLGDWGGIMRGLGLSGIDLTTTQFLEFWVNDFRHAELGTQQTGTLHFDFGYISEDFYWPVAADGQLVTGTFNREDGINGDGANGVFTYDEDIGLGGNVDEVDAFTTTYDSDANPYPEINGTAANNREDSEDLDGDSILDTRNAYFTISVELSDSAMVDVLRDYPDSNSNSVVSELIENSLAWRKYRVRLGEATTTSMPSLANITHMRIWFEENDPIDGQVSRRIQLTDLKFIGSRWERDGIRRVPAGTSSEEILLTTAETGPGESFFIGEVNNKDDHSYMPPPFRLYEESGVKEKETSLVLDYQELQKDHMVRASRLLSLNGEDYTQYRKLTWYAYNPRQDQAAMDIFVRLGADSLNFYEVSYRFDESDGARTGWQALTLDMAHLSNAKLDARDPETGWINTVIKDPDSGDVYRVRVVGAPDLRRIKRYYIGIRNTDHINPVSGYFYFDDVLLRDVKRDMGLAQRLATSVNMADVLKLDVDWSRRDADFHGLDKSIGSGLTTESWNFSTNFRINDFLPLLGFTLPVSLNRQETTDRPKYMTNSDVEIIDESLRDLQTSKTVREGFSVRLMHLPSQNFMARYLIDPWQLSLSGARSKDTTPLRLGNNKNLQGSVAYDLRLPKVYRLGSVPLLEYVPVVRSVTVLPRKISMSANYSGSTTSNSNFNMGTGAYDVKPATQTKKGTLNGAFEYQPLPIASTSVTIRSERDPFRPQTVMGMNLGEESIYTQQLQVQFTPPSRLGLPNNWLFRPISRATRQIYNLKPTLTFNSSFANNHSPSVQQAGDPTGVSNITGDGNWSFRIALPLNRAVSAMFPKKSKLSKSEERAIIEKERKLRSRERTSEQEPGEDRGDLTLSDEERRRLEEEELLREALERRAEEESNRTAPIVTQAPADSTLDLARAVTDSTAGEAASWDSAQAASSGRISIPNPLEPLLDLLRNSNPIQLSYSTSKRSDYMRFRGSAPFWYRVGWHNELDVPDSLYVSNSFRDQTNFSLSSSAKITRWMSFDAKYNKSEGSQINKGFSSRSYMQDWPDLRFTLSGIEKWNVLGGGTPSSRLKTASLDLSYKYNKTVANWTESNYNPRYTQQISPRWSMSFRNGMSTNLNVNITNEESESVGTFSLMNRYNVTWQFKHAFEARSLLAKIGLYQPGAVPRINMDVNISWNRDITRRWQPESDRALDPDTETGSSRIGLIPKFSYQISRNLSGALHLIFERSKIFQTDTVTKQFGLGLEADFVF